MLETPIEFAGRPPQEVGATLDNTPPPKELAADILKAVSPQAESITQSEVDAIYGTMARNPSIRDYFNQQVAAGNINPSTQFDAERTPVLAGLWNQYKSEMTSPTGALQQGFVEAIGPTAGGLVGEVAGSVPLIGGAVGAVTGAVLGYEQGGIPGAIGGAAALGTTGATPGVGTVQTGLIGGYLGGKIQEAVTPMTTEERARASFAEQDRASRYAKLFGETLPGFVTGGKLGVVKAVGGAVVSAGMEAVRQAQEGKLNLSALAERATQGAFAAQARDLPGILRSKALRTEAAAIKQRNEALGTFTADPTAAIDAIERAAEIRTAGFEPMTGEVTGQKDLINLQRVLTAKSKNAALQERDQKNIQAISSELSARLAQEGASPEEISGRIQAARREYILGKRASVEQKKQTAENDASALMNAANAAAEELKANGEQQASQILTEGMTRADAIMQGARNGLLSMEQAANNVQLELQAAYEALFSYRDRLGREAKRSARSELAKEVLLENFKERKKYFDEKYSNELFGKVKVSVDDTLAAANAFKAAQKQFKRPSSNSVDAIISSYKKNKSDTLNVLKERRTELAGEIGEAIASGNRSRAASLNGVKDAIMRDMDRAGEANSALKAINAEYRVFADIFLDGPTAAVLRADGPVPASQTLDQYFGSKEDLLKLRAGLQNSPTAIKATTDAMVERMSSELGPTPTQEAVQNWLSEGKPGKATGADWTTAFPELTPLVQSLTGPIETGLGRVKAAGLNVEQAKAGVKAAEKSSKDILAEADAAAKRVLDNAQGQGAEAIATAKEQAKEIRDTAKAEIKATNKDAEKKIDASVAKKFIKGSPAAVVKSIADKDNAPNRFRELMKIADLDKSGRTRQAVQNAFKQYIEENSRLSRETKLGYREGELTPAGLAVSLADTINFIAVKKNVESFDAVFGKNSPELNAIRTAQRKAKMMADRLQASPGESITNLAGVLEQRVDKEIEDNILGVIERVVSGIEPGKGKLLTSTLSFIRKQWTGDTKDRVIQLLSDAMLDPEVAKMALKKITPENLPKVNEFVRMYFVAPPQPFVTPQQESQ
jgi:F0F1-type ATP synthase membrane subunit b/b'